MNFLIYGNDCRHPLVTARLIEAGYTLQAPAELLILSPKESFSAHTDVIKEGCRVWGGPATESTALQTAGYRKLAQSEEFRRKNSVYTAEGALALAITESKKALCESKVFVLGYGFLGKECARLFALLGADVTVFSENPSELLTASAIGYTTAKLTKLSELDGALLINTIPFPVLDPLPVSASRESALLIELASTPCITKEITGLQILPAGALPSRFSPDSAAVLMYDEILSQLKKE